MTSGFIHFITGLPPGNSSERNKEYAEALGANLNSPHVKSVTLIEEESPVSGFRCGRAKLSGRCRVIRLGRRATFNDLISASINGELNCIANADVSLNFSFGRLRSFNLGSRILAAPRVDAPCDWSYDAWLYRKKPEIDASFELGRFSSDNALIYLMKRSGREVIWTKDILLKHHHSSSEHSTIWPKPVMVGWDAANELPSNESSHVSIHLKGAVIKGGHYQGGLGDILCGLSAAREYARRNPTKSVFVSGIDPAIVRAYGDNLVRYEAVPDGVPIQAFDRTRVVNNCRTARNYLGFFYQTLGMGLGDPPRLELPAFARSRALPDRYIALQPYAVYAKNPPEEFIQQIVRMALEEGLPVVSVGLPSLGPGEPFEGVDYSFRSNSAVELIRIVQNSSLLLSARSASVHVACENEVPVVMWSPNDGMSWPHAYPGSRIRTVLFDTSYDMPKIGRLIHRSLRLIKRHR